MKSRSTFFCVHRHFLCSPCNATFTSALPNSVFQSRNGKPKQFLQTLYSCSPFASLFTDSPAIAEKPFHVKNKVLDKTKPAETRSNPDVSTRLKTKVVPAISANKKNKILFGSEGDGLPRTKENRSKSDLTIKPAAELASKEESNSHIVKWTSGYDLTVQEPVSGDTKGSKISMGQRSRNSYATAEDLLPSRPDKLNVRSKGSHSR